MKKQFFLLAAALLMSLSHLAASTPADMDKDYVKVKVRFEAGEKDKRNQCVGWGVCILTIEVDVNTSNRVAPPSDGNSISGVLMGLDEAGRARLFFPKNSLNTEQRNTLFYGGQNLFVLSHESALSANLTDQLGAGAPRSIPAGRYPVAENDQYYIVTF